MSSETMTMTIVLGTVTAMRITAAMETTMAMVLAEAMVTRVVITTMTEIGTSNRTLHSSAISIIGAEAEAEVAVVVGSTVDGAEEGLVEVADTVVMMTVKATIMITTTEMVVTGTTTTTTTAVTILVSVGLGTLVVVAGAVGPEVDVEPHLRTIATERNENNGVPSKQVASRKLQGTSSSCDLP